MQINIPPAQAQQLAALAAQHGFATAEEYASRILVNAVELEAFAGLPPEKMQESVRSIERGLKQAEAGLGVPAKEAMASIAADLGLKFRR